MTNPRWMAYLDGELSARELEALQQLLAAPNAEGEAARRELAAIQEVWARLERTDAASSAPLRNAAPLWPAVRARLRSDRAAGLPRPAWMPRAAFAGTLAAGLALGAGLGLWLTGHEASEGLDLTAYSSLVDLPEGSLAHLYFTALDGEEPATPDDAEVDDAASATSSPAHGDTAEGLR